MTASQPVLHIWPRKDEVLSLDPTCVAALLYLQLVIPGRFSVEYSNDPDSSPSGQLPYLSHGFHRVSTLSSIIKYVNHLDGAVPLDTSLAPRERAQVTAYTAHIESTFGDLVAYELYSLSANWRGKIRPTFASILPIPQRYYLPERLRVSYIPRLEAAELWGLEDIAKEEEEDKLRFVFKKPTRKNKQKEEKEKFKKSLQIGKVLDRARAFLDIYRKLLGDKQLFYNGSWPPSTLDVIFAAHVHVLLQPLPEPILQTFLKESYPVLVAHAELVQRSAFPSSETLPPTVKHSVGFSIPRLISFPKISLHQGDHRPVNSKLAEQERQFRMMRWGFYGIAALTMGSYIHFSGFIPALLLAVQRARAQVEAANASGDEEDEDTEEDVLEDDD